MIFADMFSPPDTRFSPSCDPRTAHFHLTCRLLAISTDEPILAVSVHELWIDFVRHYESEYISDLPVAHVIP